MARSRIMKTRKESTYADSEEQIRNWRFEKDDCEGGGIVPTEDAEASAIYFRVVHEVERIALAHSLSDLLIVAKPGADCPSLQLLNRATKFFRQYLDYPFDDVRIHFNSHDFHPYFLCFERVLKLHDLHVIRFCLGSRNKDEYFDGAMKFMDFIGGIRSEARSLAVQREFHNFNRNSRLRFLSLCDGVQRIREARSKVLSIRIDLGYERDISVKSIVPPNGVSIEKAIEHRDEFLKHIRKLFKEGLLGYAWCLESGLLKGFHYHFWIFLNGSVHQQDVKIAELLGKHWQNNITLGRGRYWNCNARKKYYPQDKLGIGMLQRDSLINLAGVEEVARYLTKVDYHLHFKSAKRRTFGASLPKEDRPDQGGNL